MLRDGREQAINTPWIMNPDQRLIISEISAISPCPARPFLTKSDAKNSELRQRAEKMLGSLLKSENFIIGAALEFATDIVGR
jgi:hypothetical protein